MRIGIIGVGKMGGAILEGLIASGGVRGEDVFFYEVDEERKEFVVSNYGVTYLPRDELFKATDVVIVAVKPQDMETALKGAEAQGKLVVSIAAGVSSERVASYFSSCDRVVRVMPNLPLVVREGMTVVFKGPFSRDEDVSLVKELFSHLGDVVVLDEKYADAVTALSGSGPGFAAVLMEGLADGGVLVGLPRDVSYRLSVQVFLGAARYLKETAKPPSELKDQVSSPGGTTISGISALEEMGVRGALMEAVKRAYERSKEL